MTAALLTLAALAVTEVELTEGSSCLPTQPDRSEPGSADPFRPPNPKATALNSAGKDYYRDGKWEEARVEYRAAVAADPEFLAPRLNIACSLVRDEHFIPAVKEVEALLRLAYIPWSREIFEAADLGALRPRPEMAWIRRAITESAVAWGRHLDEAVLFVGRARPPLNIPATGAGFFILNPHQEIYAFLPEFGVFRQLTAEDGRVLAILPTLDRRRVVYVTADKLIRGAKPDDLGLRGVALGELTLATMTAESPIKIAGDVRRIEIAAIGAMVTFKIDGDRVAGTFRRGDNGALDPLPPSPRVKAAAIVTPRGAQPGAAPAPVVGPPDCRVTAREAKAPGKPPAIVVTGPRRRARRIGDRFGAGLVGLPLP